MNPITVSFLPTTEHIADLHSWLKSEYNTSGEGFFVNWSTIDTSIRTKQIAVLHKDNLVYGFLSWTKLSEFEAFIYIMEIHPERRRMGLGTKLFDSVVQYLISSGIVIVHLECAPAESEAYWKKQGFSEFPPSEYRWNQGDKELYKILVNHAKPNVVNSGNYKVELWSETLHSKADFDIKKPFRTWEVILDRDIKKINPAIIHPAEYDWSIRISFFGDTIIADKVKYIKPNIVFGRFIVINERI